MHNLGVEVGTIALPAVDAFSLGLARFADSWAKVAHAMGQQGIFRILSGELGMFGIGGGGSPAVTPGSTGPVGAFTDAADAIGKFGQALQAALRRIAARQTVQGNAWFDSAISRSLDRVQDIPSIRAQIGRLQQIAALVQKRLDATKDVTRRLNLEDQLIQIQRQISGDRQQLADAATASAQEAAAKAKAAAEAAKQEALAWANFAEERAAVTPTLRDDLKAARAKLKLLQEQAGVGKKTAEEAQAIWEQQQKINDLLKKMAGSNQQLKFHRLSAAQLAAQVPGLSPAQRRALAISLAGSGGGTGAYFTHPRSGQFVINGGVHLHGVQDVKGLEDELARRAKTRPQVRRGAR